MHDHLKAALADPLWVSHQLGDEYMMDGQPGWKIAYYPIFKEEGEPRALMERPMVGGTDFREVPLRYLKREIKQQIL